MVLAGLLLTERLSTAGGFFADIVVGRHVINAESGEHFKEAVTNAGMAFVMLYSPFCAKCRRFYPTFERIAEHLALRNIQVSCARPKLVIDWSVVC